MILSINGIDGSGKTTLIKHLAKNTGFFVPEHVSKFVQYPDNIVEWYKSGNIDDVVFLDIKAFKTRNDFVKTKPNSILDRGYFNVIDSSCARYQQRLAITYKGALQKVSKINKIIGFEKIENLSILLDFPFNDWQKIIPILMTRIGEQSDSYLEYLKILNENLKLNIGKYDYVLEATEDIEKNIQSVARVLGF